MSVKLLFLFGFSAAIRYYLLLNYDRLSWFSNGIGVITPQNSWKRLTEGIHLYRSGVDPYSGGIFHETPLLLIIFDLLTLNFSAFVPVVFVVCDLLTASILYRAADRFVRNTLVKQSKEQPSFAVNIEKLLLKSSDVPNISFYVAAIYLFHPYGIVSCCAKTTTVFTNLILSLIFYFIIIGKTIPASIFLSLATYQSLYPAMLLLPCAVTLQSSARRHAWLKVPLIFCIYGVSLSCLFGLSRQLLGSWNFLGGVYGFILYVEDLTPNIGLFWYFFTEMFEHFRNFFLCTFQMNAFIYVIPLVIRFRNDSVFVVFVLLGLMTIFKSYPSVGDIALYTSLLPIWSHLYPFMRQTFIIGCIFLACSVLGPILYHMWIYAGSANANFFFGTTLALNTAQIFLVTDLLFAYIKRDYHLLHGVDVKIGGKTCKLALQ